VAAPAAAIAPAPRPGSGAWLEIGGVAEHAWRKDRDSEFWPAGITGRLTMERDDLGITLGGAVATWSNFDQVAMVQRIPIDVAARRRFRASWIAATFELGPAFVFQRSVSTTNPAMEETGLALEIDLRAAVRLERWLTDSSGVYVAISATYAPDPAPVVVVPPAMPALWLGASVGLAARLF
jgi:hypothetical protein